MQTVHRDDTSASVYIQRSLSAKSIAIFMSFAALLFLSTKYAWLPYGKQLGNESIRSRTRSSRRSDYLRKDTVAATLGDNKFLFEIKNLKNMFDFAVYFAYLDEESKIECDRQRYGRGLKLSPGESHLENFLFASLSV